MPTVRQFSEKQSASKSVASQMQRKASVEKKNALAIPGIQFKLTIGQPNDVYEQEADRIADRVMKMPENKSVQRKCAACEKEEKVQRKPLVASIQKKGNDSGTVASDSISNKINSTRGGGSRMDESTHSFMSNRFGTDFSNVKIHTGDYAVQMSKELNAQAFTVGSDIYFNSGKFNPSSSDGKHLLAHELVHTVQQGEQIKQTNSAVNRKQEINTGASGIQLSPISMIAKLAAKYGVKKAMKLFIQQNIKKQLKKYASKDWAKRLIRDAENVLDKLDNAWWENVIEVVPVAGDIYGAGTMGYRVAKVWKQLKKIEDKASKELKRIASINKFIDKTPDVLLKDKRGKKYEKIYKVYYGTIRGTNDSIYVGITKRDLEKREGEHNRKRLKEKDKRPIQLFQIGRELTWIQARAIEQAMIVIARKNRSKTVFIDPIENKIRSISPTGKYKNIYLTAMKWGVRWLLLHSYYLK